MKNWFLWIVMAWPMVVFCQTKSENFPLELSQSFTLKKITPKVNLNAEYVGQFMTKDNEGYYGLTKDGSVSSNLLYSRLKLSATRIFNKHWYGQTMISTQLGRYFFYNTNRSFSSLGAALGHKGTIDELNFYKEIGVTINNQNPKSIKDLYINVKFEYLIKYKNKNLALASLSGKVDWLRQFSAKEDFLFTTRGKDDSFIKKIDQSWLNLGFDFFLSPKSMVAINGTYFTEYYPTANQGYDKWNVKHYLLGLSWKYLIYKNNLNVTELLY
jgi:hypothetical protein